MFIDIYFIFLNIYFKFRSEFASLGIEALFHNFIYSFQNVKIKCEKRSFRSEKKTLLRTKSQRCNQTQKSFRIKNYLN